MKNSYKFSSISPLLRWKMTRKSKEHRCDLRLGSESMLPKEGQSKLCHNLRKLAQIAIAHPESFRCFISYPGILAERQKQLVAGGKYVIHPYSLFSIIWNSFMIVVNLSHIMISSLRLCFILESSPYPQLHPLDHALMALNIICFLDMLVKFNIGVQEGHSSNIVMTRTRIACHYLFCWFFVDLVSCAPVSYTLLWLRMRHEYLLGPHMMPLLRCARIYTVIKDLKLFLKLFTRSYIYHRTARHLVLFVVTMHWCSCVLYLPPVITYYVKGKMEGGYCPYLKSKDGDLSKYTTVDRYQKAMFISISAFFGDERQCSFLQGRTGFSMLSANEPAEIVINAIIIFYSSIFMVYTLVFLLKIYMTKYNSTMRYHELMNQVEKYMRHKQFSAQLKKRVRSFYNYRYQERYFKEEAALDCLSEQLRNEINLHTCHKLVNKVSLFEGLPASVVGTVLGCLKPEVYMPNDLVVRGGEIGDSMYFIATGTVAVYSLKGAEVCHLEDGAHFGEVALLMKDRKRVATVVAVEITQVHRLDGPDFREFIMTYQELYERVETLASKRMHETVLIDEAFRRNRLTI